MIGSVHDHDLFTHNMLTLYYFVSSTPFQNLPPQRRHLHVPHRRSCSAPTIFSNHLHAIRPLEKRPAHQPHPQIAAVIGQSPPAVPQISCSRTAAPSSSSQAAEAAAAEAAEAEAAALARIPHRFVADPGDRAKTSCPAKGHSYGRWRRPAVAS